MITKRIQREINSYPEDKQIKFAEKYGPDAIDNIEHPTQTVMCASLKFYSANMYQVNEEYLSKLKIFISNKDVQILMARSCLYYRESRITYLAYVPIFEIIPEKDRAPEVIKAYIEAEFLKEAGRDFSNRIKYIEKYLPDYVNEELILASIQQGTCTNKLHKLISTIKYMPIELQEIIIDHFMNRCSGWVGACIMDKFTHTNKQIQLKLAMVKDRDLNNKYKASFAYIPNSLPEAVKLFVSISDRPDRIKYVNSQYPELQVLAAKANGLSLQYMIHPSYIVKKLAVQQNGKAIEFISDQTEELKWEALKQDSDSYRYIINPTEEMFLYATEKSSHLIWGRTDIPERIQKVLIIRDPRNIYLISNPCDSVQDIILSKYRVFAHQINNPNRKVQRYVRWVLRKTHFSMGIIQGCGLDIGGCM
jgi:hypothetical protein